MMDGIARRVAAVGTCLGAMALVLGCGGISRKEAMRTIDDLASHRVELTYNIDWLKAHRPITLVRPQADKRTLERYDPVQSTPRWRFHTAWGRLDLVYPAAGSPAQAEATWEAYVRGEAFEADLAPTGFWSRTWTFLTLPGRAVLGLERRRRSEHRERFRLRIPAADTAALLEALLVDGFFDHSYRPERGVSVYVRIDRLSDRKPWQPVTRLDALADRVRLQGEQIFYERAADSPLNTLSAASQPGPK